MSFKLLFGKRFSNLFFTKTTYYLKVSEDRFELQSGKVDGNPEIRHIFVSQAPKAPAGEFLFCFLSERIMFSLTIVWAMSVVSSIQTRVKTATHSLHCGKQIQ